MVSEDVMNRFNENGAPPHRLELKVNDICILLRHVDKKAGLTNNKRVRIVKITKYRILIASVGDEVPITASLPRFRFNIKLPFGKSFKMQRTQFPLRLAYAVTINKAQGQQYDRIIVDITKAPFSHGHLYVALSRSKESRNIRFFCNKEQIFLENDNTHNDHLLTYSKSIK